MKKLLFLLLAISSLQARHLKLPTPTTPFVQTGKQMTDAYNYFAQYYPIKKNSVDIAFVELIHNYALQVMPNNQTNIDTIAWYICFGPLLLKEKLCPQANTKIRLAQIKKIMATEPVVTPGTPVTPITPVNPVTPTNPVNPTKPTTPKSNLEKVTQNIQNLLNQLYFYPETEVFIPLQMSILVANIANDIQKEILTLHSQDQATITNNSFNLNLILAQQGQPTSYQLSDIQTYLGSTRQQIQEIIRSAISYNRQTKMLEVGGQDSQGNNMTYSSIISELNQAVTNDSNTFETTYVFLVPYTNSKSTTQVEQINYQNIYIILSLLQVQQDFNTDGIVVTSPSSICAPGALSTSADIITQLEGILALNKNAQAVFNHKNIRVQTLLQHIQQAANSGATPCPTN